jgi:AraC-like DNA-binding protein
MSIEHVFDEMEISAYPFALCELHGRCSMGLGSLPSATLHYVLAGRGELVCRGRLPIPVARGTLVLVPASHPHILHSFGENTHPLLDCHPAELGLAVHLRKADDYTDSSDRSDYGDGKLLAICSRISISIRGTKGLVDLVREPIVEVIGADNAIQGPVDRLLHELSAPKLGSQAMVRALLFECMVHLLRGRLQARDQALNWMAALTDERLWTALKRMLEAPGDPHTVESLATAAGMSRSTFASRFSAACGRGSMELLRELRMHRAASLLAQSDLPVKRVAELVGFHSRSAFSRTFSSATGLSPQQFRNAQNRA